MLFCPILGNFWCSVVTSVTFISNVNIEKTKQKKTKLNYFNNIIEKNPKNPRVIKDLKNPKKNPKILKNTKKSKIVKTCK